MPTRPSALPPAIFAAALAASAASAATIAGDTYSAAVAADGGATELVPATEGVAGSGDPENFSFDITGFGTATMEVGFLSETEIQFAAFGSVGDLADLVYTVSGLDFTRLGAPAAITGVTLTNEQALRDEFDEEEFTSPSIAFTATSFTATFGFMNDGTFADGLAFRFRIRTEGDVPPIPLPAAGWLLLGGLGALAAASRRR
jgi:hypothetical protein